MPTIPYDVTSTSEEMTSTTKPEVLETNTKTPGNQSLCYMYKRACMLLQCVMINSLVYVQYHNAHSCIITCCMYTDVHAPTHVSSLAGQPYFFSCLHARRY